MSNSTRKSSKKTIISVILSLAVFIAIMQLIILGVSHLANNDEEGNQDSSNNDEINGIIELDINDVEPHSIGLESPENGKIHLKYIDHEKIMYTSYGSSSCPTIISKASYDKEENSIELDIKDYTDENNVCTMDIRAFAQIISHEEANFNKETTVSTNLEEDIPFLFTDEEDSELGNQEVTVSIDSSSN